MSQQIFHMGGFHELKTTAFDERNFVPRQFDFQIEGMEARAKQHGDVPQRHALLAQFENFLTDKLRLHLLAAGLDELGTRARAFAGEQALVVAFFGALNDLVGQIQNRLGAAVVFFELDDTRAGEVFGKIHDVAKIGAAERINALRVVADHRDVVVRRGEQPDDFRLQVIGVLIFVDHDEAVSVGEPLAHFGVIGQQVAQPGQEIVIIDQRLGAFIIDVAAEKLGELKIDVDQVGIFQLEQIAERRVLVQRHAENLRHSLFARKAFFFEVEPHFGANQLNHVFAIGPVHNSERRRQTDMAAGLAQD